MRIGIELLVRREYGRIKKERKSDSTRRGGNMGLKSRRQWI